MKLNKTTLKDLIYEILLEEEAPAASVSPAKAGLKTGVMSQAQQRAGAIERTKGLKGVQGAEISIISQFEELLNNLAQGADLTKYKPQLTRIMEMLQKAVPQEETGDSQLQEEGPDLAHYQSLCEKGDERACSIAASMEQRQGAPPPTGPRVQPGFAGGMEEGRRRTKRVLRRRK